MDLKSWKIPSRAVPRAVPWIEKLTAETLLRAYYLLPRTPHLEIQGMENIPSGESVIFVMEGASPSSFVPFLFGLYQHRSTRYPAFCAPRCFYDTAFFRFLLPHLNALPVPAFGEMVAEPFISHVGRLPTPTEISSLWSLLAGEPFTKSPGASLFMEKLGTHNARDFLSWYRSLWEHEMLVFQELVHHSMVECNLNVLTFASLSCIFGDTPMDRVLPVVTALLQSRPLLPVTCTNIEPTEFNDGAAMVFHIGDPVLLPDDIPFSGTAEGVTSVDFAAVLANIDRLNALALSLFP
ncbi:hypothetical protein KKF84_10495 [Myxococcota bacterium]|nr:hypothetical protein [Myxococcota bacterium]MBU1535740.1 hypothetical protein [Myxococcota bacterium]